VIRLRKITVLEKIYRNHREAKASLAEMLGDLMDLDVRITSISRATRDWATVSLEGPDEVVAERYLESVIGRVTFLDGIDHGDVRKGKVVDLGKVGYGIYVDVGVVVEGDRPVDALIPIFSLKKHLGIRGSVSIKRMSQRLGIIDYLPMDVRIFKVDRGRGEIEGRLTNSQARRIGRGRNRIYVVGETRRKIKNAIQRSGNSGHVVRVKRLGLLESEVQCSKDVDPREIVRAIGPMINASMSIPMGL